MSSVPPTADPAHPLQMEALLAEAYQAGLDGQDERRLTLLRRAADLAPDAPDAVGALAEALAERGAWGQALPLFRRAHALEPGQAAWGRGLITALLETGSFDEATVELAGALARRGDDAATHRLAARLAQARGDGAAALRHAREACHLAPNDLAGVAAMALVLTAAGEALGAAETLAPLLAHAHPADPALPGAHVALGRVWAALSEPEKAARCWRDALTADPTDAAGAGMLLQEAAHAGEAALTPAYVRALFDRYADRFDGDLTRRLRYQAPDLLRQALDALHARLSRSAHGPVPHGTGPHGQDEGVWREAGLDILDLGCGTGLAGEVLRDRARLLAGVDLAPRMVERARGKGVYDRLWAGDLMAALTADETAWDLLVAADVLVYLGDLTPVLAAVAHALRPGGRFAGTVENWGGAGGFYLHAGRRYAHGERHVHEAAAAAGLTVEDLRPVTPRWEKGAPVDGRLMILRK